MKHNEEKRKHTDYATAIPSSRQLNKESILLPIAFSYYSNPPLMTRNQSLQVNGFDASSREEVPGVLAFPYVTTWLRLHVYLLCDYVSLRLAAWSRNNVGDSPKRSRTD